MYISRQKISDLYLLLTEDLEDKIPRLLALVPDNPSRHLYSDNDKADFIRWVARTFDPTPNAEYITWLIRMVQNGQIPNLNDVTAMIPNYLEKFHRMKRLQQFPSRYKDVNRFKTVEEFLQVVYQHENLVSNKEKARGIRDKGITLMDTLNEYKLYIVTNFEAASKYFTGTRWCVVNKYHYDDHTPPFYFFTKNDEKYTLLHLKTDQCRDVDNMNKPLDYQEQQMMESEKMTSFVMTHDNEPESESLQSYFHRVGKGYDDQIGDLIKEKLYNIFKSYNFSNFYIEEDQFIEGNYSINCYLKYNFSGLEEYFDDKKFQRTVIESLNSINMYPDYLDKESFSEDGLSFNEQLEDEDSPDMSLETKIRAYLNEVKSLDNEWEGMNERFAEHLTAKLLQIGYITSGWSLFNDKVLQHLTSDHFEHARVILHGRYVSGNTKTDGPFTIRFYYLCEAMWPTSSSYLFEKFLGPITRNTHQINISGRNKDDSTRTLEFIYTPKYSEDMTFKQYMQDFKIFRFIDKYYDEIEDQINELSDFLDRHNHDDTLTGKEKIPVLNIRSRKAPKEQGYFEFQESKIKTFSDLVKKTNRKPCP